MPAYHSKLAGVPMDEACTCGICPLRTEIRGPAPLTDDEEDIIDEVLNFLRANVFFRNFEIKGPADRTLIYLTLHAVQCLVKCEKIEDKPSAIREFRTLATKQFALPGEAAWPLGTLFPAPADKNESDLFRTYFKQAREELANRLIERLFNSDGTKNKWWQSFSKRKFMGKELKDF